MHESIDQIQIIAFRYLFIYLFICFLFIIGNSSFYFNFNSIIQNASNQSSNNYYRYYGSITYPPCTEGVTWSIYEKILDISSLQVNTR